MRPWPIEAAPAAGPSAASTAGQSSADGTWREKDDHIIVTVNGKELKLSKSALMAGIDAAQSHREAEGSVHGRLLQGGAPLANCSVAIIPMQGQRFGCYCYDEDRETFVATTDAEGEYVFPHVPPGKYKMTWLPENTKQWIRRIQMKPDVFVHVGQDVRVKEIRAARRTVN